MDSLREQIFGKSKTNNDYSKMNNDNSNIESFNNNTLENSTLGALSSIRNIKIKNTPSALSWIIFLIALIFSVLFI